MKKLLLSAAALCCFVSAQAQWSNNQTDNTHIFYDRLGNVGIGTYGNAIPKGKLEVGNSFYTANGTILVQSQDASNEGGEVILLGAGAFPHFHMDNLSGRLRFYNSTVGEAMNLFSDGKVGIAGSLGVGTYNVGSFKLAVEGKMGAREVVVTTAPWSDYVFASNYRLRPLSEVAQFIQENKHLPEVPTAAEIEKKGNSLAETDALLLKKIEELTLYVIEQNKKIEILEQKVSPTTNK
jgi:hypothetical protein